MLCFWLFEYVHKLQFPHFRGISIFVTSKRYDFTRRRSNLWSRSFRNFPNLSNFVISGILLEIWFFKFWTWCSSHSIFWNQKSILFHAEEVEFMFSIDIKIFKNFHFLLFFAIFEVRSLWFPDFYFLQIWDSRPEIKSFHDSPRGKISDFENELSKVFKKSCFVDLLVQNPDISGP